jgi:hypothetical protein
MQRPTRRNCNAVVPDRLTVREEDGDIDVRFPVAGVEDAGGFVRDQGAIGKRALPKVMYPSVIAQRMQPIGSMITSP